jgi:hypothetical protein
LSRQHARIRREDGYLIEPLGDVWMDGRKIHRTTRFGWALTCCCAFASPMRSVRRPDWR